MGVSGEANHQMLKYFHGGNFLLDEFSLKLLNLSIFCISYFGLFLLIKSKTSLSLYFLFLVSSEHTIDVSLFEIGKNAIGPFFVKI